MRGFWFRSILYIERRAHSCLAPSQNSNVWLPNIHVWTHFEPIFWLRVHCWIQTTVSQLAGVRKCHRKRQLSFLYNVFYTDVAKTSISNFRLVGTAFSSELPQARTVLLFVGYSGQIFPRRNLLIRSLRSFSLVVDKMMQSAYLCVILYLKRKKLPYRF